MDQAGTIKLSDLSLFSSEQVGPWTINFPRLEAIASRLEAIATGLEAIAIRNKDK